MGKKLRKSRLVSMFLLIATIAISQTTYADQALSQVKLNIPSNWAQVDIDKAKENNLVPEKLQEKYRSDITREEFSEVAVKLYEALNGKETPLPNENPFADTENIQVMMAYKLGIVNGKGDGKFDPYNTITREEISVMLYNTLQAVKPDFNYSSTDEYIFSDYDTISSWAREAVNYLYYFGVISGVSNNEFNPKGNTSTEQAIVLAERMYEKVLGYESFVEGNLNVSRGGSRRQDNDYKSKLANLIAQEMGKPYKWGGTGPDSYDCSGLVYSLFGKLDISLPRTSRDQAKCGTYVSKEDLIYGDLVFFASNGKSINHVGIYVGNGEFVHSPNSGEVVKTTTLMSGYYANNYYTARRVLP